MIRSLTPSRFVEREGSVALVAISAGRARIVTWRDQEVRQLEIHSGVPRRHRSIGHVRRDPTVRHGGTGRSEIEMTRRRGEYLHRYLDKVAEAIAPFDRVVVTGGGPLPGELAGRLADREQGRPLPRTIELDHAGHRTDRQLVARLRQLAGHPPLRRQATPRPQTGAGRRTAGRAGDWEAVEAELETWEELTEAMP